MNQRMYDRLEKAVKFRVEDYGSLYEVIRTARVIKGSASLTRGEKEAALAIWEEHKETV